MTYRERAEAILTRYSYSRIRDIVDAMIEFHESELSRLKDEGEGYRVVQFELCEETWKKLTPIERMKFKGLLLEKIPAEQSDKLTAEEIEEKFTIWVRKNNPKLYIDEESAYYSVNDLIKFTLEYASQFVGEKVTDEMIEKWARTIRIDFATDILIEGAKALRDGLIGK